MYQTRSDCEEKTYNMWWCSIVWQTDGQTDRQTEKLLT